MYSSSTKESDIQFQLHFLDCQPNSIIRSLNNKSILDHLYRVATNKIFKFDKSYQRKESNRVTDIDQLSLSINPVLSPPESITRYIPIEIIKNDIRKISNNSENKTSSIEVKTEGNINIPQAPPLPHSLDLAIKSQSIRTEVLSPDRETLWTKVRYYFCLY
jgi:hypothetical protein